MQKLKKTIWLLSAYRADSHAFWADWLLDTFDEFRWHKLELPGRHFRWRIRGNPLSWLHRLPEDAPDLIVATSMVDLATLKGLQPSLAAVPCLYYFHENQFAYPVSKNQLDSVEPKMVQLYGALAADSMLFNSNYNRDSFLQGVSDLLQRLPDEVPEGIVAALAGRSEVLPVMVKPFSTSLATADGSARKNPRLILWNHRWEYDKAPSVFVDALLELDRQKVDFQLALLGNRASVKPDELRAIEENFADRIVVNERVSAADYEHYLALTAIVVSTAIHEFQGLSVMQAISAGAVPLVPDALCYRDQYDSRYRYPAGDSDALASKLAVFLDQPPPVPDISPWCGGELIAHWRRVLRDS